MKVIFIVLILLIPAWCYADGNELLKRCNLLVEYTDSDSPDISLSAEMMFCAGFMQGITNMNLVYQTVLKSDAQFCLPEWGISNSDAARIVVKQLREGVTQERVCSSNLGIECGVPMQKERLRGQVLGKRGCSLT